jgi:cell fate regulator YaaT (PSP1 superfamily)
MSEVVQVKNRGMGELVYYTTQGVSISPGGYCIVEAEKGWDFGEVVSEPEDITNVSSPQPLRKLIRMATEADIKQIERIKAKEKESFRICGEKIEEKKLPMRLINVEISFDGNNMIFYFSAEGRVDFRELVKDLAAVFKARIDLRQIGVRDEAKMLGGIGCCGRMLCCASFLKDFEPVTVKMARDQQLPLNPTKISGLCGRLMCCLMYEYKTYREKLKKLPKPGAEVMTPRGAGKVVGLDILKERISVEFEEGNEVEFSVEEVEARKSRFGFLSRQK